MFSISRALNARTTLAVSGVLLSFALTNASRAMLPEESPERKLCNIHSGREAVLKKYALEIIEHHNKDEERLKRVVPPSIESQFLEDQHIKALFGFQSLEEFVLHLICFFDYSYVNTPHTHNLEFSFKPHITNFLYLDKHIYREKRAHNMSNWRSQRSIETPESFSFQPNELEKSKNGCGINTSFQESCYKSLYAFTQPEALKKLKKALFDSDFETYKFVILKDKGSLFNFFPIELKSHVMDNLLMVTDRK